MDYEFDPGPIVEITNRMPHPVEITFHGKRKVFPPGKSMTNAVYAEHALRHLPLKGTSDPRFAMKHDSQVGVEAWGNDVSPVTTPQNPKAELIDRTKLPEGHQAEDVELVSSREFFEAGDQSVNPPFPRDGAFGMKPA